MLIGYSVLYVNDDIDINDVLWNRRVVYNTWDKAIHIANEKAKEEMERFDGSYIVSLIKANSQHTCESYGSTLAFTIKHKQFHGHVDGAEIYIVPVYDE